MTQLEMKTAESVEHEHGIETSENEDSETIENENEVIEVEIENSKQISAMSV